MNIVSVVKPIEDIEYTKGAGEEDSGTAVDTVDIVRTAAKQGNARLLEGDARTPQRLHKSTEVDAGRNGATKREGRWHSAHNFRAGRQLLAHFIQRWRARSLIVKAFDVSHKSQFQQRSEYETKVICKIAQKFALSVQTTYPEQPSIHTSEINRIDNKVKWKKRPDAYLSL